MPWPCCQRADCCCACLKPVACRVAAGALGGVIAAMATDQRVPVDSENEEDDALFIDEDDVDEHLSLTEKVLARGESCEPLPVEEPPLPPP
eukprot:1208501-Lingulodinium_polyedra.AAC.1